MIRYDVSTAELIAQIAGANQTWLTRAARKTKALIKAGKYSEASSIWSEVKPAFISVQFNKCVFCERQFEDPEYGKIEYDLEHFRPKSSVKTWPHTSGQNYSFPTGSASTKGYYWLAYDITNYAASCKSCNTPLKSNYFPVASKRAKKLSTGAALKSEKPYLCYPIGNLDDNPENLLTFRITTAVPADGTEHQKRRGQIIIDFFALNEREQLHRERARMILLLGNALEKVADNQSSELDHAIIASLTDGSAPHSGCTRAFEKLWASDQLTARDALDKCRGYVAKILGIPSL